MQSDPSFLGTGWSFPPRFSASGAEVETVSGVADVHESLQILLSTALGERVMQDTFGCGLDEYLFAEISQSLINGITGVITDAIIDHESRIQLESLDVSEDDAEHGKLLIKLDYTIKSTNSRYNMVYPFYINEGQG